MEKKGSQSLPKVWPLSVRLQLNSELFCLFDCFVLVLVCFCLLFVCLMSISGRKVGQEKGGQGKRKTSQL